MKKRQNIQTVDHKRKRQGKTNYKKRFGFLLSNQLRLVYRASSKNIYMQIVKFIPKGDQVLASVSSQHIRKKGWTHAGKNLPSAYLVGYMIGKQALKQKIDTAILDIGLLQHKNKSRVYAAVKGAIDAGLKVPVSEKETRERNQGKLR